MKQVYPDTAWQVWKAKPWWAKEIHFFRNWVRMHYPLRIYYTHQEFFIAKHYWWFGIGCLNSGAPYIQVAGLSFEINWWKKRKRYPHATLAK